jgi:hypothetical protein
LLVASHWLLDLIVHAPDLPLAFDRSPRVGLGLEYSLEGEVHWRRALVAEVGLLATGIAIDRRSRSCPRQRLLGSTG